MNNLIEQYYRAFNERRLTDAAALFASDADVQMLPGMTERGGGGYLQFATAWIAAFPNATFTVERVYEQNEWLSEVHFSATGNHRGMLDFGVYRFRPTGDDAVLHMRELLDVRGGRIVASMLTVETHDLLNQLTTIDYDELSRRVERICALGKSLACEANDERRRDVADRLGVELDAARRALRPHFYR